MYPWTHDMVYDTVPSFFLVNHYSYEWTNILVESHLANATHWLSERRSSPMHGLLLLSAFPKSLRRCQCQRARIHREISQAISSRVALQVKKAKSRWILDVFNPSFFPWIPKMISSTVISLVVYITAVLGSPPLQKRGGLLQLKIHILYFHLCDYRRVVRPSCRSA